MDRTQLQSILPVGGLGRPLHWFDSIGSTNDYANQLAAESAPHGTLVVADAQTAGRGQHGRQWITPPGVALAATLILRPPAIGAETAGRLAGLASVALCQALEPTGASPKIKWPNDVLLEGKKVAGVLVELGWLGDELEHAVVGMGVNVSTNAVPPAEELDFPATSVEESVAAAPARAQLLRATLSAISAWLPELAGDGFLSAWESRLAYLNQKVTATQADKLVSGVVLGLTPVGGLRLDTGGADPVRLEQGLWRLRPVDSLTG